MKWILLVWMSSTGPSQLQAVYNDQASCKIAGDYQVTNQNETRVAFYACVQGNIGFRMWK